MNTRFRLLGLAAALALLPGELFAQEAAGSRPHMTVSPDVEVVFAERSATQGFDSFDGTAPEGMADDSAAEFGDVALSAEEIWDLVLREPKSASIGREVVIGVDNRSKINATTTFPNRAIGQVTFTQRGGNFLCTGWLINRNTVVTAGHCLHEGGTGSPSGWSTNIKFYPGRNGASAPYGSCTGTNRFSVAGWVTGGSEQHDYGAFKLNCNIGNTTGFLGFWSQVASLVGTEATIRGYPGDKPSGTQWTHTQKIVANTVRQIFYPTDTFGGQSGSPVLDLNRTGPGCTGHCSSGIHAYGTHGAAPHTSNNHGTRIVQAVFNNLVTWRNAAP